MKRFFLTLVLAFLFAGTFAQVSITSGNYYQVGLTARDTYVVGNEMNSVPIANIVGNPFVLDNSISSSFEVYNKIDTVTYDAPRTEGAFVDATCSFADKDGMRMHIKVTDDKAVCLGVSGALSQFALNEDTEVAFDAPMEVITFPAVLSSQINSNAHGIYKDNISTMEEALASMAGSEYGSMIYNFITAEYDSIMADIQITYTSNFDESGFVRLSGDSMKQGYYEYLREMRQYTYVTNMYLRRINGEFQNINECTLTNPMFAAFFNGEQTINIGEALSYFVGLSFPVSSTNTVLNYWTSNDNYPIVEMTTNEEATGIIRLAIRYGDGEPEEEEGYVDTNSISANIYPNPTTDFLSIEFEEMTNGTIRIYSVNGSLVKEEVLSGLHNSVNVNDLSKGNYFFRVSCGDKEINGKFAKN